MQGVLDVFGNLSTLGTEGRHLYQEMMRLVYQTIAYTLGYIKRRLGVLKP